MGNPCSLKVFGPYRWVVSTVRLDGNFTTETASPGACLHRLTQTAHAYSETTTFFPLIDIQSCFPQPLAWRLKYLKASELGFTLSWSMTTILRHNNNRWSVSSSIDGNNIELPRVKVDSVYKRAYRFSSASPFPVCLRLICFFGMATSFSRHYRTFDCQIFLEKGQKDVFIVVCLKMTESFCFGIIFVEPTTQNPRYRILNVGSLFFIRG